MSTRGQHNKDTVQRLIEETEENKKYELEQLNSGALNKIVKQAPLKEINLVNTALKITNANVQNTLKTAQDTVKEVSKANNAINNSSTAITEANKKLSEVSKAAETLKELSPVMGSLSLATLPSTILNAAKEAIKTRNKHEATVKAIYSNSVKSKDVAPSIMNDSLKSIMKVAGVGATGSFAHDMLTTGTMSGLTKGLLGASSPGMLASSAFGGISGLGGLVGATGGAAIPAGIAMMIGASLLHNKFSRAMDAKNPLNKSNTKALATNINYRSIASDPMIQSERAVAKSKINALGPQGLQVLTQGELIQASLLADIVANTSILDNIYEDLINRSEINTKTSNRAINKSTLAFGGSSQDGLEFNSLANGGRLNSFQKMLVGLSSFNTQVGNFFGAISTIYNTKESNKGAWANRDAYLAGGDVDKAKKRVAQDFKITLAESNLLSFEITNTLSTLDTHEERMLAATVGLFKINQLSAKKLVEMARTSGGKSFIGSQANAERNAAKEDQERYNYLIDGLLRSVDETIQKIPGFKILSNIGHIGTGLAKGTMPLFDLLGAMTIPGYKPKTKNWFKGLFTETKEAYQDNRLSDTVKNENMLRESIGMEKLDNQALAYAYLANTYPKKFDQLLMKLGVNVEDTYTDKYTGDRVTAKTLSERNAERSAKFNDLIMEQNPEESLAEMIKQSTIGKLFNKNRDRDIRARYSHLGDIENELNLDPFGNNMDVNGLSPDTKPFANFRGILREDSLTEAFNNFAKSYSENTAKAWDHVWTIKNEERSKDKFSNYSMTATLSQITKILELNDSTSSGKNPLVTTQNLNDQMSKQDILRREEMVALSIVKYLPFLEGIYENTKRDQNIRKQLVAPDEQQGGILDGLGGLLGGVGGVGGGLLAYLFGKKALAKFSAIKNVIGKNITGFLKTSKSAMFRSVASGLLRFGRFAGPLAVPLMVIGGASLGLYKMYEEYGDSIRSTFDEITDLFTDTFDNSIKWFKDKLFRLQSFYKESVLSIKKWINDTMPDFLPDSFRFDTSTDEKELKDLQNDLAKFQDKNKKEIDDKIKKSISKDSSMVQVKSLQGTLENTTKAVKDNEQIKTDLKNYITNLEKSNKKTEEKMEYLANQVLVGTQANVQIATSNADLNKGIGAAIYDQFKHQNKEEYVLDFNIGKILPGQIVKNNSSFVSPFMV